MDITFIDVIAKHGISVVTVGAGIYMLWRLIEFTIVRLTKVIDNLVNTITEFTVTVDNAHANCSKNQENLQRQHEEMIKSLGRINGYK